MKRYLIITAALAFSFTAVFLMVESFEVPVLADPSEWLARGGAQAALIGVGLLVADVALPVPSSIVMIAHGALFGAGLGSLLSIAGMLGAAAVGFAVGRRGESLLERLVAEDERARVNRLLDRWGALAIVATRPVPVMAETCAIMAGASNISWAQAMAAALAGSIPPALLYGLTGSVSASFQSGTLMFGFVIIISGLFWLVSYRLRVSGGKVTDTTVRD